MKLNTFSKYDLFTKFTNLKSSGDSLEGEGTVFFVSFLFCLLSSCNLKLTN